MTTGRTLHKEDVYASRIVVLNSDIHAVRRADSRSPRRWQNLMAFFVLFADTRRFEASEESFGACESCFASGL